MREPKLERIDRLRADLLRAREKANEWQARTKDLERQVTELENLMIIQAVRAVAAAPEDLRDLLDKIQTAKESMESNFEKEN